jgi:pimeloyl-ACP methyl ester carboxylesterase
MVKYYRASTPRHGIGTERKDGRLNVVSLAASALAPGVSPVPIRYREAGAGPPIVLLHGGWGYAIYPFDRQIAALAPAHRLVAADRTGYGGSGRLERQETDFHRRAALETLALLGALGIERAVWWGHSDGAVIALLAALEAPDRVRGVIAEAAHFDRAKPRSRDFFETMRDRPEGLGERVVAVLEADHGPAWQRIIRMNGDAWLRLGAQGGDLYDERLTTIRVPVLVLHGARDPRTEPGELDRLTASLGTAGSTIVLPEGAHSPHHERATADDVTRLAAGWLASLPS